MRYMQVNERIVLIGRSFIYSSFCLSLHRLPRNRHCYYHSRFSGCKSDWKLLAFCNNNRIQLWTI